MPNYKSLKNLEQARGLNWKAIILWGIILGVVGGIVYVNREAVTSFLTNLPTAIGQIQLPSVEGVWTGITEYIAQNPLAAVVGGIGLCTAGYTLYSKIKADRKTEQALQEKAELEKYANDRIAIAEESALNYKQQFEDATANDSRAALLESQQILQQTKNEFELKEANYKGQVQSLHDEIERLKLKVYTETRVK